MGKKIEIVNPKTGKVTAEVSPKTAAKAVAESERRLRANSGKK